MEGSVVNMEKDTQSQDNTLKVHTLNDTWTVWAHLPHDTDWSIKSYKKIQNVKTIEETVSITETLPHKMIRNCMLFIMRDGIKPTWEDEKNKKGGSFSYKVSNKIVPVTWKNLTYSLVGETLTDSINDCKSINGITISPKKNFCVIKIWMADCKNQDPTIINDVPPGIGPGRCLFKKHNPEY